MDLIRRSGAGICRVGVAGFDSPLVPRGYSTSGGCLLGWAVNQRGRLLGPGGYSTSGDGRSAGEPLNQRGRPLGQSGAEPPDVYRPSIP
ncbi:hypothetical protein GCM10009624_02410 [Gordonia sinesedis]